MEKPIRINLGCGRRKLEDWINVDIEDADVTCDISLPLPFEDNYADELMAIHVIEHFYVWTIQDLLKEWKRVIKPGGRIILECPNLLKALESAMKTGQLSGPMFYWVLYGDPGHQNELMCHHWAYTPATLSHALGAAGFREVKQKPAQYHKKEIRDMRIEAIK